MRVNILLTVLVLVFSACTRKIYEYNDEGEIRNIKWVKRGQVISEKSWYPNGNLKNYLEKISVDTLEQANEEYNEIEIIVAISCKITRYHKSGQIKERGLIRFGEKHGVWHYWDEEGNIQDSELYYNGELQKVKE